MYYGDLGKRVVAWILDAVILSAVFVLLAFTIKFASLYIFPIIWFLYFILLEGSEWHATLGKKIMGMYVGYEDGSGITYATAILRWIGKKFSGLFLGIGYIMGLFSETKQCLHDMIAKTYVFSEEMMSAPAYQRRGVAGKPAQKRPQGATGAQLVGVTGPLSGTIYDIDERGLLIGRDSVSCQVVIPDSQTKVSRNHCYVTYNPMSGMFVLNDRNSTHGTFLAGGRKLTYGQPAALKSGDRFYLATTENTFEVR